MSDLISRQAAIDALGDKPLAWTEGEYELGLQTQWQSDVDALKEVPSAEPEQRWISVKERLPEYGQAVLVVLDGGSMTDGVWSADHDSRSVWDCALDNRTWYDDENIVIAWMPLPEPYKE